MASRLERIRKMQESMEKLRGEYGDTRKVKVKKASAGKKKPAKKKPASKKRKENKFSVVGLAGKILKRGKQLKESVK